MSRVLAVCGMPGSGKGEFAQVFMEAGIPVRSMGDMVREEVARRDLEVVPEVFGQVASDLRREFGEDVLAVRLTEAVDELLEIHPLVLIDGLRGTATFEARDEREKGWGLEDLIADADVLIENNDDLVQFQNQIRTWLATLI